MRGVGGSFLLLATYVAYSAAVDLAHRSIPRASRVGIALACASLIVMPLLSRAKRRLARTIGSAALRADAMQTEFCAYLSAILLAGLVLNALLGWWWADPFAALLMVPLVAKEGLGGLRGRTCCD